MMHFTCITCRWIPLLQCIYPTEDRLRVQAFLRQQPLQMKVIKQLSDCDFIYIDCRLHRAVLVNLFWMFINNFSGVKKEANTVTSSYFVIQVLILKMMSRHYYF